MYFDYAQYVRGCLHFPLSHILFLVFILIVETIFIIKEFYRRKPQYTDFILLISLLCFVAFFFSMYIGILMQGGIHLVNEQESDAIEMTGTIEEIEGLGRFRFPRLKSDYGYGETNGVQFTIDGIQCTAIVKGDLQIGDVVVVKYLPKSGYVLAISEVN